MNAVDKISRIVNVMNSSKDLSNEEYNRDSNVLDVYRMIHGEEKLQTILSKKTDLHLNKFYSLFLEIENIAKSGDIPISDLNQQISQIEDIYPRNWQLLNLVEIAIHRDELDIADQIVSQLPDEDKGPSKYKGHRKLLNQYAKEGNLIEFEKRIKFCKTGKFPRNEIHGIKSKMIQTYSEQHGITKGLELCRTNLFGEKYASSTILWKASLMTLNEIDSILNEHRILYETNACIKAELYAKHFFDKRITEISELEFDKVRNEISKIDLKVKKGDGKLRDYLYFDLGSSTRNKSQIIECKKNIKSPFYKKELNYHIKNLKEGKYDGLKP